MHSIRHCASECAYGSTVQNHPTAAPATVLSMPPTMHWLDLNNISRGTSGAFQSGCEELCFALWCGGRHRGPTGSRRWGGSFAKTWLSASCFDNDAAGIASHDSAGCSR